MYYGSEFFWYEGQEDSSTFFLDEATTEKVKDDPNKLKDKVVAFTGNYIVGYGSSGATPAGFIRCVESISSNKKEICVSVYWNKSHMGVSCTGSEAAGNFAACDGNGGVIRSTTPTNAKIWAVEDGVDNGKVATVYIHG